MPRTLNIAAAQMNATPAPVTERLERAADLVAKAAADGAQLVVLPELFNTGYEYHVNNYTLPEPIDGQTISWMRAQAAKHQIHLAGSLMLLDGREVFNSLLLVAPDGRRWRYDKNYPWAFERAYYRDGTDEMIAQTDLGAFGMMICWDYAHPEMWQRYAGRVDAMIIASSPPTMTRFRLTMPNNHDVDSRALGPIINRSHHGSDGPFGTDLNAQLKWLNVPGVNASATGTFNSALPRPRIAAAAMVALRPDLWRHIPKGEDVTMHATYYQQTKVVGAGGEVLAHFEGEEGYVVAPVQLPDERPPTPQTAQPEMPYSNAAYFLIDVVGTALTERLYRDGIRRQWGQKMAPFQRSIRWSIVIGLGVLGMVAGLIRGIGHLAGGGKKSD
jgi:hypothetical protein